MYQNLTIIGNLGRDPELRYTPHGNAVTSFPVATNQRWTDRDGKQKKSTTWWRVTAWNRLAEICAEFLAKGRLVLVVGTLQPDPETCGPKVWIGKDGKPHASYEVRAITVKFIGSDRSDGEEAVRDTVRDAQRGTQGGTDDDGDIPF